MSTVDLTPGQRLQVLIDELRLNQAELGRMCGTSRQYVNGIVHGALRLTQDFVQRVAEETYVNVHWLYTGEEPMLELEPEGPGLGLSESLLAVAERLEKVADNMSEGGSK